MGHLSYKAFSSPIFNQCGTPTPHLLFSTISTSSVSFFHIIMLPRSGRYLALAPPLEGVNGTHRLALPLGRFRHKEPLPCMAGTTIGSDTTCWETPGSPWTEEIDPWDEETSCQENSTPHLTQNLKAVGSWVTSLI